MENSAEEKNKFTATEVEPKTKKNEYTPEEKKFADGEGTKLDEAIDADEAKSENKEK